MRRGTPPTPTPRPAFVADWIPSDTPKLTRDYCPECEPDANQVTEMLSVLYCDDHRPSVWGSDDATLHDILNATTLHYTFNEAGGDDNRAACDFFHRRSG